MKLICFKELCNRLCSVISHLYYQKGAAELHKDAFHHKYGSQQKTLNKELNRSNYVTPQCFDIYKP